MQTYDSQRFFCYQPPVLLYIIFNHPKDATAINLNDNKLNHYQRGTVKARILNDNELNHQVMNSQ